MRGDFYTNSYGNSQADEDSLDNDEENIELVSVFVGPKECEMVIAIFFSANLKLSRFTEYYF